MEVKKTVTLKNMPCDAWKAAKLAATEEEMQLGEWVAMAILEKAQRDKTMSMRGAVEAFGTSKRLYDEQQGKE
ncbi:hypothetical protein [Desulfovibrio ferrophilus]|uniref:3-hydroxyacyl-CoA dehydrogenase NAD-binding protein n=1 Tax=Desulfovibrio ferrophilus TaxID=241368 RepID=A0A2Z6B3N0_9BACT|nr:hypothetical protein [Desulfovibrio ferrophilus]BBD10117.1 3-hydroxyacyl-CoA dehydrogenase NAD-binding protein [Desulfovibrio ferrophilus]